MNVLRTHLTSTFHSDGDVSLYPEVRSVTNVSLELVVPNHTSLRILIKKTEDTVAAGGYPSDIFIEAYSMDIYTDDYPVIIYFRALVKEFIEYFPRAIRDLED